MFFLSQPSTPLKSISHPKQYQIFCARHLSIAGILVPLQLVLRPIRGMLVGREGVRTKGSIIQYVTVGIYLTSIR